MHYVVVMVADVSDLARRVNQMIADGYKPQGGISTVRESSGRLLYLQTMLNENKRKAVTA